MLFLILTSALRVNAQVLDCDEIGLDNQLYNGKLYSYFPPKSVIGNQFLASPEFSKGTIWIDGKMYVNVLVNYDILNQELLVSFKNLQGANAIITLSMAYVDTFFLDNKNFIVKRSKNDDVKIYQLIQVGSSRFLIRWHKNLDLRTSLNTVQYEFSKPLQTVYYQSADGRLVALKNNASFYKLFPKKKAVQIKKYMRSNKMKIAKMSFLQYINLLNYTESVADA
jgi:hypothetical protein